MDSFKLTHENGTYEMKINYPAGIYLVHLKSDTGFRFRK